jgi:drug/metabolite transporter (DMT)-like permease
MTARWPALRGGAFAVLAATLFGISTPLVQRAGEGVGPFTTAALLYAGAALLGFFTRKAAAREAAVQRGDLPRIAWMALFGAVIGPWRWPGDCSTPAAPAPR